MEDGANTGSDGGADAGMDGEPDAGTVRVIEGLLAENAEQQAALVREHERMVAASLSSNADDEHDPEGATIAFEREQVTALLGRARRAAEDLRLALQRLDDGTYGQCERCGGPISPQRLEARPGARTCIGCAAGTGAVPSRRG